MNFFERRRWRKTVKHMLHEASHVYHMRADLMSEQQAEELLAARARLADAWRQRDAAALDKASARLSEVMDKVRPPVSFPALRENVEVFVVAFAVAMAFRTYFIQPFKIPTASMQPTLYGITVQPQANRQLLDYFPMNLLRAALFGERYVEVRAKAAGEVRIREDRENDSYVLEIGGYAHAIRRGMKFYVELGERVQRNQRLASGCLRIGDHIFVDKVRYNFVRPKRGDIIVFSTDGINFPDIRANSFYIKRLAALPGDRVRLVPPYLMINGEPLVEPWPFQRILRDAEHGYHGYAPVNPHYGPISWLSDPSRERVLAENEFLPLGDNSAHSLDGRYFGPIKARNLVGPAFMVYWPFSKRFGPVR